MVAYSFKKRFVEPIRSGLGFYEHIDGMIPPPKRQTIRAEGKRRHARPGETLQLYTAMRTKQCQKIGEARCVGVDPIRIIVKEDHLTIELKGSLVPRAKMGAFARSDGFVNAADMLDFWKAEHGIGDFHGFLIRWEPLT